MKIFSVFWWSIFFFCFIFYKATFSKEQAAYQNKIIGIHEIPGQSKKIVVSFASDGPIVTYAPLSYGESLDQTTKRYFMPKTKLETENNSSLEPHELNDGVELLLQGKNIKKLVGDKRVLFIVS